MPHMMPCHARYVNPFATRVQARVFTGAMNGFRRDRELVRTFAPMQGARRDPAFPHYPGDQRDRAAHQGRSRAHRGHRAGFGGGLGGRQRRQGGDTGDRARPACERRGAAVDADQLPPRGGRAAAALRVAGRPVRAARGSPEASGADWASPRPTCATPACCSTSQPRAWTARRLAPCWKISAQPCPAAPSSPPFTTARWSTRPYPRTPRSAWPREESCG